MKSYLLIVIQFFFTGITLSAQMNYKINVDFENKVNNWLVENNVPAVGIGIIEDGKIKYIKIFGELKKGISAPDNTIFNIASITKPVVTMLILKLVETGQWNLDDPLFHYWVDPEVANDSLHRKLTTRHILTHQSGFVNWRRQHPTKKLTFDFKPGTNYQYSGEGFVYLGHALEIKFNKSLAKLADSILFEPIGMKDSHFYWDKNMDGSRFAYWHNAKGNIYEPSTPEKSKPDAAGSMLTTVEDFCRFSIYVINGAGLSPALYNDMISCHVKIKEHYARGLGWNIVGDLPNEEYALSHSGASNGVKTMGILLPKSKRGIVVFTNGDNGMLVYNYIIREYSDIGEKVLEFEKGSASHEVVSLSSDILSRYVGTYLDSYGRNLSIFMEDRALMISGKGVPTVKLYPESENKFFLKDFDVQFEFVDNDSFILTSDGKVDCTAKRIMDKK